MNRLDTCFSALHEGGRKALIPFITAGDPSLEATVPVMHALVDAGADVVELGMPFSDPMADGPVIQRSSERALQRKAGTGYVFECVRAFRERDDRTPVVLMGYLNPVEMRGPERFAREAAAAGVDGLLLVDLPPEEATSYRETFQQHGLALIPLAAPTTSQARREVMARQARGYIYYVSYAGVTGSAQLDPESVLAPVKALRAMSNAPVVVGFGIRDAASAAALAPAADGVVVGSALVESIASCSDAGQAAKAAAAFLAPLRRALDGMDG